MSNDDDQEAERIAGHLVNFLCLDSGKSSAADFRFQGHCHFLPRVGERLEHKKKLYEVTRVYHRTVDMPGFEHPSVFSNVLCRYVGDAGESDAEVERLLRSLA